MSNFPIYRGLKSGKCGWEQKFRSATLTENLQVLETREFSLWDVKNVAKYAREPGHKFDPTSSLSVPPFEDIFFEWLDWDGQNYGCAITQNEDDEWWIYPFYLHPQARMPVVGPIYERWWFRDGFLVPTEINGVKQRGRTCLVAGINPDDPDLEFWDYWSRFCGNIAIIAFMFCHCKNVDLVERLPRRHEQRQATRKGEPILKYHEIVIDPNRTYANSETVKSSVNKPTRALHIARGHFATYSEEKPLFGKYAGTFWIPAHMRGNKEFGEVKSTYRVKAVAS